MTRLTCDKLQNTRSLFFHSVLTDITKNIIDTSIVRVILLKSMNIHVENYCLIQTDFEFLSLHHLLFFILNSCYKRKFQKTTWI